MSYGNQLDTYQGVPAVYTLLIMPSAPNKQTTTNTWKDIVHILSSVKIVFSISYALSNQSCQNVHRIKCLHNILLLFFFAVEDIIWNAIQYNCVVMS